MHIKILFSLFMAAILLLSNPIYCQELIHYTSMDGLPDMHVNDLEQDSNGKLWIGSSYSGVIVFNGNEFARTDAFTGPENHIISIVYSKKYRDRMYAVGKYHIQVYDVLTEKLINKISPTLEDGDVITNGIMAGDEQILFMTTGGYLYSYSIPLNRIRRETYTVKRIYSTSESSFMIGLERELLIINGNDTTSFNYPDVIKRVFAYGYLENQLIIATDQGLYLYNGNWYNGGVNDLVLNILVKGESLYYSTPKGTFRTSSSLDDAPEKLETIRAHTKEFFLDSNGHVWFGTMNLGIFKQQHEPFKMFYTIKVLRDAIHNIIATKEDLFLGTWNNGIVKSSRRTNKETRILEGVQVLSMVRFKEKNYFCTWQGMYVFADSLRRISETRDLNVLTNFGDTLIYFGDTEGNLGYYDILSGEKTVKVPGKKSCKIYNIKYLKDQKIGVSTSCGLFMYTYNLEFIKHLFINENILDFENLSDSVVAASLYGSGISIYDYKNLNELAHLDDKNYLTTNFVHFIIRDEDQIIVGGDYYLTRLLISPPNYSPVISTNYNAHNGFNIGKTYENSYYKTRDSLFIGTLKGAAKIALKNIQASKPNPLHLRFLIINKKDTIPASPDGRYNLPAGINSLGIYFNQADLNNKNKTKYQSFLEGYQKKQGLETLNEYVEYNNIKSGEYCLILVSKKSHQETGFLKATIVVAPFFYETTIFQLLMVFFGIILLLLFMRYVEARKERKFSILENIRREESNQLRKWLSMDFHDELGNKLAKLLQYINVYEITSLEDEKRLYIEKIRNSARGLYSDARQYIYSLDPEYTTSNGLYLVIKKFVDEVYKEESTNIKVNFTGDKGIVLDSKSFFHLKRIAKEVLTNSYKYSGAEIVKIEIYCDRSLFELRFSDNGRGFNRNLKTSGTGLRNISLRAKQLKAKLTIDSQPGTGTKIALQYKMKA